MPLYTARKHSIAAPDCAQLKFNNIIVTAEFIDHTVIFHKHSEMSTDWNYKIKMSDRLVNDELERIWKEETVA